MGLVAVGAPFDIIPDLARLSGIESFVETGTSLGGTSRAAATYFESVYTVEKAGGLYEKYSDGLRQLGNIEPRRLEIRVA